MYTRWYPRDAHNSKPTPRKGHTATLVGKKMIVYGGVDSNTGRCQGKVLLFDTETHTWTKPLLPGAHPLPLVGHTANLVKQRGKSPKIFFLGGRACCVKNCGGKNTFWAARLWILDPDAFRWELAEMSQKDLFKGREGHSTTLANGFLYIFGGHSDQGLAHNNLLRLDLEPKDGMYALSVVSVAGKAPAPRYGHAAALLSSRFLTILGGHGDVSSLYQSDIWVVDLLRNSSYAWVARKTRGKNSPPPMQDMSATVLHNTAQLLLFGGCQYPFAASECSNKIHVLNTSGEGAWAWRPVATDGKFLPFNRGEHTAVLLPAGSNKLLNKILVWGGCDGSVKCFDEVVYLEASSEANFCDPMDCAAHGGMCQDSTCVCRANTTCSLPCPSDCSDHGECNGGACSCDPGFTGPDCALEVSCAADCAGHGECNLATAVCACSRTEKGAWFGSGCSQWWNTSTTTIRVPATDLSPSGRLVVPTTDRTFQILGAMGGKVVVPRSPKVPFSVDCPVRVDTSGGSVRPLEMRTASAFVYQDLLLMTGCHGGQLSLSAYAAKGSVSLHLLMSPETVLAVNDKLVFDNPRDVVIVSDIFPALSEPGSGGKQLTVTVALHKPTALFHDAGSRVQVGRLSLVPHSLPALGPQKCLCEQGWCDKAGDCNCYPGWGGESCAVEICPANCSGPARGRCSVLPLPPPEPVPTPLPYIMPIRPAKTNTSKRRTGASRKRNASSLALDDVDSTNETIANFSDVKKITANITDVKAFIANISKKYARDANVSSAPKVVNASTGVKRGKIAEGKKFATPRFLSRQGNASSDRLGCICKYGYTGTSCQLSTGCGNLGRGCGPHATCLISLIKSTVPGKPPLEIGQCKCHKGWGGAYCNIQITPRNCTSPVRARVSNPGGRGSRCDCRCGFGGLDCSLVENCNKTCSQNGICNSGKCICSRGWSGPDCDEHHCQVDSDCLHGDCVRGVCLCHKGFTGRTCECEKPKGGGPVTKCEDKASSLTQQCNTCSGHGERILSAKPHCKCEPDFDGAMCERRKPCPLKCSGRGACKAGKCTCDAGFAGRGCQRRSCPLGPDDSGECSGHGLCINREAPLKPFDAIPSIPGKDDGGDVSDGDASSAAKSTTGDASDSFIDPIGASNKTEDSNETTSGPEVTTSGPKATTSGPKAVASGLKVTTSGSEEPAEDAIPAASFSCFCSPEYSGVACARKNKCPNECSKHGVCSNGRCECDNGWTSRDCSKPAVCPTKLSVFAPTQPTRALVASWSGLSSGGGVLQAKGARAPGVVYKLQQCAGHGKCIQGRCFCAPPFYGTDCSRTKVCDAHCSEHGVCQDGACQCNPGFSGPSCNRPVRCPDDCNGHGVCYLGICACRAGFSGVACNQAVDCPNDCHLHGECVNGACECDDGFYGSSCEKNIRSRCPHNCSSHGECVNNKCSCDLGWTGDTCNTKIPCKNSCSGHGRCWHGECYCNPGFEGESCSTKQVCRKGCVNGVCAYGRCFCIAGFAGDNCTMPMALTPGESSCAANALDPVCGGHGVCVDNECNCEAGWYGRYCKAVSLKAKHGQCANDCSGKGECVTTRNVSTVAASVSTDSKKTQSAAENRFKSFRNVTSRPGPKTTSTLPDILPIGLAKANATNKRNSKNGTKITNGTDVATTTGLGISTTEADTTTTDAEDEEESVATTTSLDDTTTNATDDDDIEPTTTEPLKTTTGAPLDASTTGSAELNETTSGAESEAKAGTKAGTKADDSPNSVQCLCKEDWHRPDCSALKPDVVEAMCSLCQRPESHGDCHMGLCFCDVGYSGRHCRERCPNRCTYDKISNEARGACVAGKCVCRDGFSGDDCAIQAAVMVPDNAFSPGQYKGMFVHGHGHGKFVMSLSTVIILVAVVFSLGLVLLPLLQAVNEKREMMNARKMLFENNMGGLADRINDQVLLNKKI